MNEDIKKEQLQKVKRAEKIKIGAVSYLNTKPLIYGFENGAMKDEVTLLIDYPSNIADALLNGSIDIGLVPIATVAQMPTYHFVGNYGIAANGPVASVCLFSEVPIHQIESVLLDYQSRTSVQLVKILLKEHWKVTPVLQQATANFITEIKGTTAAVVIGDRAFEQRKVSKYMYDLSEAWKNFTGLPFVFAAWVSKQAFSPSFVQAFDAANQLGLDNLDKVIAENPYPYYSLSTYYTQNIKFKIDGKMLEVIQLFLSKIK